MGPTGHHRGPDGPTITHDIVNHHQCGGPQMVTMICDQYSPSTVKGNARPTITTATGPTITSLNWAIHCNGHTRPTITTAQWPCQQGKSEGFDSCDRPSNLKLDSNRQFFRLCDREIWWMTLQKYRTPLLCNFKLCASFRSHWWIQTWVTVRKRPIWVKLDDF